MKKTELETEVKNLKRLLDNLYYAAQDVEMGRSIHNSRFPDKEISGPVWDALRNRIHETKLYFYGEK